MKQTRSETELALCFSSLALGLALCLSHISNLTNLKATKEERCLCFIFLFNLMGLLRAPSLPDSRFGGWNTFFHRAEFENKLQIEKIKPREGKVKNEHQLKDLFLSHSPLALSLDLAT